MRRTISPERAEALRVATSQSVLDHLRIAGVNVPASCLALGLAAALAQMLGKHVNVRHRGEILARCRMMMAGSKEDAKSASSLRAEDRRQAGDANASGRSAAVTR